MSNNTIMYQNKEADLYSYFLKKSFLNHNKKLNNNNISTNINIITNNFTASNNDV